MKLSKAQQAVVEIMRKGAIVTEGHSHFHWHLRKRINPLSDAIEFTNRNTIMSLVKKGIIEKAVDRISYYRLTEPDQEAGAK